MTKFMLLVWGVRSYIGKFSALSYIVSPIDAHEFVWKMYGVPNSAQKIMFMNFQSGKKKGYAEFMRSLLLG